MSSVFDQRHQTVKGNQTNINKSSSLPPEISIQLKNLEIELKKLSEQGNIEKATNEKIAENLNKVLVEFQKERPDKQEIVESLSETKSLLDGLTSATSLVTGIIQAIKLARDVLP